MKLSNSFKQNIVGVYGRRGEAWLKELPLIIKKLQQKHDIIWLKTYELTYNFVSQAIDRKTNEKVVIKIGVPDDAFELEKKAVQLFDGKGMVRYLKSDEQYSAYFMECIEGENKASTINVTPASNAMKHFKSIDKNIGHFPTVKHLFDRLKTNELKIDHGDLCLAQNVTNHLFKTSNENILLHGDLHAGNILDNGDNWIAIDPKGVVGERNFEPAQFFLNVPLETLKKEHFVKKCLSSFEHENNLSPERVLMWAYCKSVLSVKWMVEDNDPNWEQGKKVVRILKKHMNNII
ncbi:aminoglycoside phosphotransferase family protein [Evansella halocellulosilytica]|uniref:aminoglycoside phosphotransferase family protein n=1 Tax=Evansella halocellulosilytica TaxID=2011013 RepID=UPI000BB940F4|nr:aminoglycoside phosphotransferase family protein [Evansella halocellulosilytica]